MSTRKTLGNLDPEIDTAQRIMTFEDACNELGKSHPFVVAYEEIYQLKSHKAWGDALLAFLQLRIITKALNGDWTPSDNNVKYWVQFRKLRNLNDVDEDVKIMSIYHDNGGVTDVSSTIYSESSYYPNSSDLALRSNTLAYYAAEQFTENYAKYFGII